MRSYWGGDYGINTWQLTQLPVLATGGSSKSRPTFLRSLHIGYLWILMLPSPEKGGTPYASWYEACSLETWTVSVLFNEIRWSLIFPGLEIHNMKRMTFQWSNWRQVIFNTPVPPGGWCPKSLWMSYGLLSDFKLWGLMHFHHSYSTIDLWDVKVDHEISWPNLAYCSTVHINLYFQVCHCIHK